MKSILLKVSKILIPLILLELLWLIFTDFLPLVVHLLGLGLILIIILVAGVVLARSAARSAARCMGHMSSSGRMLVRFSLSLGRVARQASTGLRQEVLQQLLL